MRYTIHTVPEPGGLVCATDLEELTDMVHLRSRRLVSQLARDALARDYEVHHSFYGYVEQNIKEQTKQTRQCSGE